MTTTCDPTSTFDLTGLLGPLDPVQSSVPAAETDDRRLSDERAALFTTGGIQDEDDRLGSEDFYELMIDPHASEGSPQQQNQPMMMPPMAMGGRGADAGVGAAAVGRPPIGAGVAPSGAGAVGAAGAVPGAGMGVPGSGAPGSVGSGPGAVGAGGLGSNGAGGLGSSGVGVASPAGGLPGTSGLPGTTAAGVGSGADRFDTGSYGSRAYDPSAAPNRVSGTGQAADTSTQPYVARHAYPDEGSPGDLMSAPASHSSSDPAATAGAGVPGGDIPGADLPAAGMPSRGVPSGGVPGGGVPSGGVPGGGLPSGGVPAGGAPVGGSRTGEQESSNAWSLDDLTAEAKLWDEAAKAHQTSVVADHILTQQDASGGLLNQVSRSIRGHVSELERLSLEAAKVMQGMSGTLEHTVTNKAETEAANTDAARSGTQGDPR